MIINKNNKLFEICLILICVITWNTHAQDTINTQNTWVRPYCLNGGPGQYKNRIIKYTKQLSLLLQKSRKNVDKIWDQDYLEGLPKLKKVLNSYINGEIAQQVRNVALEGMTVEQIHTTLTGKGFIHTQVKMTFNVKNKKGQKEQMMRDLYGCYVREGSRVMTMDVYVHKDGSLVRVKPQGTPMRKNNKSIMLYQPQVIKAVLLERNETLDEKKYDYSFNNEAFKISESGFPIPKGRKFGFHKKILGQPYQGLIKDILMSFVHLDINVSCRTIFKKDFMCAKN